MASTIGTYISRYARAGSIANPVLAEITGAGWAQQRDGVNSSPSPTNLAGEEISGLSAVDVENRRNAVFAAVVSKIPAGITRVLDIGCGNGDFAKVLHATRPEVIYRGIDLSLEAIAAATANLEVANALPANVELEAANFTEYLLAGVDDWDFIISTRCIFRETARSGDRDVLRLIDSKAPKGWFIYGNFVRMVRPDLQYVMQEALTNSTNPTEHYFKDHPDPKVEPPQSFLDIAATGVGRMLEHPAYIVRDASLAPARDPKQYRKFDKVRNGEFERERARGTLRTNDSMTEYKTATYDANGRITGEVTQPKASAPVEADLDGLTAQRTALQTFKTIQG